MNITKLSPPGTWHTEQSVFCRVPGSPSGTPWQRLVVQPATADREYTAGTRHPEQAVLLPGAGSARAPRIRGRWQSNRPPTGRLDGLETACKQFLLAVAGALFLLATVDGSMGGCIDDPCKFPSLGYPFERSPSVQHCHDDARGTFSAPCYGYHPTCWREWPDCCVGCPPPAQSMSFGVIGNSIIAPPHMPGGVSPADRPTIPEPVPLPAAGYGGPLPPGLCSRRTAVRRDAEVASKRHRASAAGTPVPTQPPVGPVPKAKPAAAPPGTRHTEQSVVLPGAGFTTAPLPPKSQPRDVAPAPGNSPANPAARRSCAAAGYPRQIGAGCGTAGHPAPGTVGFSAGCRVDDRSPASGRAAEVASKGFSSVALAPMPPEILLTRQRELSASPKPVPNVLQDIDAEPMPPGLPANILLTSASLPRRAAELGIAPMPPALPSGRNGGTAVHTYPVSPAKRVLNSSAEPDLAPMPPDLPHMDQYLLGPLSRR